MSGGQKQRIAIARALVRHPCVLSPRISPHLPASPRRCGTRACCCSTRRREEKRREEKKRACCCLRGTELQLSPRIPHISPYLPLSPHISRAAARRGAELRRGRGRGVAPQPHRGPLPSAQATSALDAESEAVVQAAIDSMIAQGGMTVVVIAHRLSTIRNADRICVVKGGRVAEEGPHHELMARPTGVYAKLLSKQVALHSGSTGSL